LGGNLRLRVPNVLKFSNAESLKEATGNNSNSFYHTDETPAPVISSKATITAPELKKTFVYDIPTQAGKLYTWVAE
jgi:alpha-L-fucosidase 2